MNKKSLSEQDIRTKFVTPAIKNAGWDMQEQVREAVTLTQGRIIVYGEQTTRGERKEADYVLYYKPNIPLAVIEAKKNIYSIGSGMQQALDYSGIIDVPFTYSTNGDAFLEHDRTAASGKIEKEIPLNSFPSPAELWQRYRAWKNILPEHEAITTQDYYADTGGKEPRYYQSVAINRTVEAIARGQNRILLVMATGTGKTCTAFHIIWRLWKSHAKKRILFLADRNILVDQTRINDFKPFGQAMTQIKSRRVDKAYEIYLSLYQAITGPEEEKKAYKDFSPGFFDLIVVDECHRGSADEDSAWREILEYFHSATQIGMTATPRETRYISNIDYFGEPVYTYSLKQGIEDGFLAPYKVIRIDIDKDLTGWRPPPGKRDKYGQPIENRIYTQQDYDQTLVLEQRTELVAKKITEFLKETGRYAKSIVFCEDIEHAERMRQALVNENADLASQNHKYIMRITGDEKIGKAELDSFIDPESRYPVIVTTSRLLSTGVDSQTCKLIVLDQRIQSLSMFKQIIGRGTRIREDYDKLYFTIMDFKKATQLFADPDFDGEPAQIYDPGPDDSPAPPQDPPQSGIDAEEGQGPPVRKYYVDDVEVSVIFTRVQYPDKDGKLITESLRDYSRKNILSQYRSLHSFIGAWNRAEKKRVIIEELYKRGVLLEELARAVNRRDYDPFDLVCHVAFDQPPLTRRERARNVVKKDYFAKYGEKARMVLDALLEKYTYAGIEQIEDMEVLRVEPLKELGTPLEIVGFFGGEEQYRAAFRELESHIYSAG